MGKSTFLDLCFCEDWYSLPEEAAEVLGSQSELNEEASDFGVPRFRCVSRLQLVRPPATISKLG